MHLNKTTMAFTIFFIFYLIFGLVFYDLPMFQMVDEIFPVAIFVYSILKSRKVHKYFPIFAFFLIVYVIYSFVISSNSAFAIFFDAVCISKPFLTLFAIIAIKPNLSAKHRQAILFSVFSVLPVIIILGVLHIGKQETTQGELLSGARLGFCCIYLALTYYLFSAQKNKDIIVMSVIAAIGICVPTSKYVVTIFASVLIFLLTRKHRLKLNWISVTCCVAAIIIIVALSISDIMLYMTSEAARGAMYLAAGMILIDYIPLGSGLASFGTPASAIYYSDIYHNYSLDMIHGLGPSEPLFISDAFFPVIAEFGFLGIILLSLFFAYLFRSTLKTNIKSKYRVGLIILISTLVEAISDVSFIGNRGVFSMMLLGYILSTSTTQDNAAYKDK